MRCPNCGRQIDQCVCRREVWHKNGIYLLYPKIDPELIKERRKKLAKVRSRTETETRTILYERRKRNESFMPFQLSLLAYVILVFSLLLWFFGLQNLGKIIFSLILIAFMGDYIFYRIKRNRILRAYLKSPHILESREDWAVVSSNLGDHPKTMDDACLLTSKGDDFSNFYTSLRYQLVWHELEREKGRQATRKESILLDVGTGDGKLLREFDLPLSEDFWFIGLDAQKSLLKLFRPKANKIVLIWGDGMELPFFDETVDFVVCSESLEHFSEPEKGISEMSRVLKSGGILVLTVPNALQLRNLNVFHIIIDCLFGRFVDGFLQKTTIHPNMWFTANTFHWDFSLTDVRKMIKSTKLVLIRSYSSNFPFPYVGPLKIKRIALTLESILRFIPLTRFMGMNLISIFRKV